MKTLKLMLFAAVAAAVSVGCSALEPYAVDAPDDLQEKIDAYEEEKKANQNDDYIEIPITIPLVGAEDNSSAFFTEFSQYFTVPSGKKLYVEFENHGTGVNNWNNWNVCVALGMREVEASYSEYFVLRADWWGWGTDDYNGSVIEFDYGGGEVNWDEFREKMQGAYVTMSLDHARAGAAYLEVHSVAKDGFDIVEKYNQAVSATEDINLFLFADGSHLNVKKAYLVPSEIAEIPDYDAESLTVSGYPAILPLGEEDFWGDAVATVTFEDGYTTTVPKEDLTISEPDLSEPGVKTVVYSYNYTKLGKLGKSVVGYYTFEVADIPVSIEVTQKPALTTYYVYEQETVPFSYAGLEVTATRKDGSTYVLDNAALSFGEVTAEAGEQEVEISFAGISTSCTVTVVEGTEAIGLPDVTTPWWAHFMAEDVAVPSGESVSYKMMVYSDNLENWHSVCTILRNAELAEYAVVRMDNWGWGAGYDGIATTECDWNFDVFAANINMSLVEITVTNNGDDTADVRYDVVYANGEEHFQLYKGIAVKSADLQMNFVPEAAYVVFYE